MPADPTAPLTEASRRFLRWLDSQFGGGMVASQYMTAENGLRDIERAAAATVRAEVDRLRVALLGVAVRRTIPDRRRDSVPCWCPTPPLGRSHTDRCDNARAALGDDR